MGAKGKQAKFFCENCGEEVAQNARFCKKCGRFFSAVRCPQCGKVGSAHAFVNGCPACGYADKKTKSAKGSSGSDSSRFTPADNKGHFFVRHPFVRSASSAPRRERSSSSLPVWIYGVTFLLLVVMIILFMRCSYV